jgi:hypothetical protein
MVREKGYPGKKGLSEIRGQKQKEKKRRKGKDRRSYLTVFGGVDKIR